MNYNVDDKVISGSMELVPPSDHLCYVRCNFCNTVLAVGIPCKRLMESVTVKCGHCSNVSLLSTRPSSSQHHNTTSSSPDDHTVLSLQGFYSELKKGQASSSSSSSTTTSGDPPLSPKPPSPFVVKPPEKKHRLPSAYNRFMKEEIQRIKAANPEIPHREAFSAAAKNLEKRSRPRFPVLLGDNFFAAPPFEDVMTTGKGQQWLHVQGEDDTWLLIALMRKAISSFYNHYLKEFSPVLSGSRRGHKDNSLMSRCNQTEASFGVHCVLLGVYDNFAYHHQTQLTNGT
ncbi:Protein DROOPING LEAF [Senna tora]|uniref:Protein DROOPING LEAF n=1 Tax=Senna tora TaxID=362788 RepID=A0A834T408_9FABA|nr:Protein DROOPING LEAF [Senna tora]